MFALIISIIAIALVISIGAATLYYGGDVATSASAKATAAQYRTEASQIAGAITTFRAEGNEVTEDFTLNTLVPHYLKTLPNINWSIDSNRIYMDNIDESVCLAANNSANMFFDPQGAGNLPAESEPTKGIPICAETLSLGVPCCVKQ